jgi:hypothetical protein
MAKYNQSTISRYWTGTYIANKFLYVGIIDEQTVVTAFGIKANKSTQDTLQMLLNECGHSAISHYNIYWWYASFH